MKLKKMNTIHIWARTPSSSVSTHHFKLCFQALKNTILFPLWLSSIISYNYRIEANDDGNDV